MPLIPDKAAFQNSLASLPLVTYQPGETVIVAGSKTERLLILKTGAVAVVKDDTEIAQVAEPGAVFGELSVLLDQPHTADVRALEASQFHIANATTFLTQNPIAVLNVATVLAHRLDGANHALIQIKYQLQSGEPHSVVVKTVSKIEGVSPRRRRRSYLSPFSHLGPQAPGVFFQIGRCPLMAQSRHYVASSNVRFR